MTVKKKIIIEVETKGAQKNVKKLDKNIKDTDKSTKTTTGGMKGMTMATKGFGLALKAAGVGIVLSLLVKLVDVFSGNIEMARKFERIGNKLSVMFDVLRDTLEPVADFLVGMFENPLDSLLELGKMLVQNIINRFMSIATLGKGVAKVLEGIFTLDFDAVTEGATGMTQALVQFSTGLDVEQQNAFVDGLIDMGDEMIRETDAADKLTIALQNVRDRERDMLGIRANANKLIAQSRLLAEDDTKSLKERLVALKAAVAEEKRVAAIELAIQQDKVDAMQGMIDLGKSSEEDIQELAQERARLTELQTASILKQKRVAAEIGTFTSQVAKEEERIEKERLERIDLLVKAKEHNLEITEEMTNKEIKALIKQADAEDKLRDKSIEELRKATLSKEELELDAAKTKYEKLLAQAEKYGQDTALITEQYNQNVANIQDKYDKEEVDKQQKIDDDKFAMANKRIDQAQEIFNLLGNIAQEELTAEKNALQEQLDAGLISQEEFDKESAKIEKESIKREKRNAMLNILVDTAQGVAAAIKAGAGLIFPANLGAIASGVASVLAGIVGAKSILNKVPGGSAGDDNTSVQTPTITGSLIPSLETVSQPTLGEQPPIQAYVIENDISNAQALQEELEIQSSL